MEKGGKRMNIVEIKGLQKKYGKIGRASCRERV